MTFHKLLTFELLVYADDTCLIFQHKDITKIEMRQINFLVCFVTSLSVRNKVFIFVKIKQNQFYLAADVKSRTYLSCIFDETYSGESMAIHVINKINSRLFL